MEIHGRNPARRSFGPYGSSSESSELMHLLAGWLPSEVGEGWSREKVHPFGEAWPPADRDPWSIAFRRHLDAADAPTREEAFPSETWHTDLSDVYRRLSEKIDSLVAQYQSRSSSIGALHSLGDGSIHLNPPLIYSKEEEDDGVSVSVDEFGIYAWGETDQQAVVDLGRQFTRLWNDLSSTPDEELGTQLLRTKRYLMSTVLADAENIQRP